MSTRKPIYPVLPRNTPLFDKVREKTGFGLGDIVGGQDDLVARFRAGIAEGLGVPIEAIKEAAVRQWIIDFIKTFIAPEFRSKVAPRVNQIQDLGKSIGSITQEAFRTAQEMATPSQQTAPPTKTGNPKKDVTDLMVSRA